MHICKYYGPQLYENMYLNTYLQLFMYSTNGYLSIMSTYIQLYKHKSSDISIYNSNFQLQYLLYNEYKKSKQRKYGNKIEI